MEMIVACAITMILAIGLGSIVMLASRVMPRAKATTDQQVTEVATRAMETVAQDVAQAIEAPTIKARGLLVTHPDRNADGKPDTVQYSWSGVAGDPLVRTANADTPVNVIDRVRTFALTPTIETRTATMTGAAVPSGVSALASYTGTAGTWEDVKTANWPATAFTVTLPAGAKSYTITKVDLYVSRIGLLAGSDHVELRTAWPDGTPTNTVLARANLPGGILALSAGWQSYTLTYLGSSTLTSRMLAIVVAHDSGSNVLQVATTTAAITGVKGGRSTDTGANFTMGNGSLAFRAAGIVYTQPTTTTERSVVRAVQIGLGATGMAIPVSTVVRTTAVPATE